MECPPATIPEMLQRANHYVVVETLIAEKCEDQKMPRTEASRGPPSGPPRRRMERTEQATLKLPNTPLNLTWTEIFLQIRAKGFLKTPNPMKSRPRQWDWGRYYRFHRDYGHDTEECYDLKNQIESLIHRGHLSRYVSRASRHPI
ncbi:hypothetical protein B296_00035602 [Ensete ventricosum]|uniref:Uncharacterized protein n=1 Tax=Ensete ventricosum TaxID=4639 RepID=A0A426YP36_ENSVE|nr:hypothetical protein B296_00035602 [Ensete ventricosum]